MATRYLIRFAQSHEDFRLAELEALARHEDVGLSIVDYRGESPFCTISINSINGNLRGSKSTALAPLDEDATPKSFISKSILSRSLLELWATGVDYETLHSDIKASTTHLWPKYCHSSFKFSIDAFCGKRSSSKQREIIDSFSYMGFKGKIAMKDPENEFVIMEEWDYHPGPASLRPGDMIQNNHSHDVAEDKRPAPKSPRRIFFGRLIGRSRRELIDKHDLKKRPYISTTSMDAELALVTANLALAGPGKLFLDPFVGTGGFMVAASELGATSLGSDIDGRSFKGKQGIGLEKGVGANFKKYNITSLFGDCIVSDLTNTPFISSDEYHHHHQQHHYHHHHHHHNHRRLRWLDGIISDPPYGVREGLKVLGIRNNRLPCTVNTTASDPQENSDAELLPNTINNDPKNAAVTQVPAYMLPDYVAPKKPYSFNAMMNDILNFAAATLVDKGRLAFWMPSANTTTTDTTESLQANTNMDTNMNADAHTNTNREIEIPLPQHPHLKLVHVCTQPFNKWSRRLLVYERKTDQEIRSDSEGVIGVGGGVGNTIGSKGMVVEEKDVKADVNVNMSTDLGVSADDLNPFRKLYFRKFQT